MAELHRQLKNQGRRLAACLTAGAALALVVPASAQEPIAPTEAVEAPPEATSPGVPNSGLGRGNVAFHPGVKLEGGFDSNVFFEDEQERVLTATLLGVTPSIELETREATSVDFKLRAGLTYLHYLSDDQRVSDQSGLTLEAGANATFNPNGAVALKVSDDLRRTNEPTNGASFDSYNRLYNEAAAGLVIQPGGKLLTVELGGAFALYRYQQIPDLDSQRIGLDAQVSWKFLPKTALKLIVDWDFITYDQADRSIPLRDQDNLPSFLDPFVGDNGEKNVNSQPLRIQGGLAGLMGSRFSVVLLAGFGKGFYDTNPDFTGLIARVEGAYEIGPTSRLRLGYMRDFADSTFSNYFDFHKFYGHYSQQFFGRLDLKLEAAFTLRQYAFNPGPVLDEVSVDGVPRANAYSTPNRVDPIFLGQLEGTFYFTEFFYVGARYQLDVNGTDFVMITGVRGLEDNPDDINVNGTATAQFVKHRAFLTTGVRW